ncbi:hypothetical protein HYT25_00805 [Candidatus Pacearchaeota archaeon]|nr:hypothetical protein [Candidatus Pacearchaeota archaeon]
MVMKNFRYENNSDSIPADLKYELEALQKIGVEQNDLENLVLLKGGNKSS